jgi:hypothetical protein
MTHWMRQGTMLLAAAGLVAVTFGAPSKAEARDNDGHGVVRVYHGFRPYFGVHYGHWGGPYWGAGWWGPGWWGPGWGWGYPYYPEGSISMHAAMLAGYGAIKIDAKPKQAEAWADGKPIAEARDLDGTPSYLWLKEGEHRIQIYKGGFVTFDQKVDVHAGMRTELRVQLEPGPSVPPSSKAPEAQ